MTEKLLSTTEISKHYKVHVITIYNWIKKGLKIAETKEKGLRKYHYFHLSDVDEFLIKNRHK